MKIQIVTDSASDLSDEEASSLGIQIVPLSIRFGEEELIDRIELGADEFYERMNNSEDVPQTAAPSPGAFKEAFEKCFSEGAETVICINISSELSATIQAAEAGAREMSDKDIRIFDSKSVTGGLGTMVLEAAKASQNNQSADEIIELLDNLRSKTRVYAAIDTLENLKKGGRIAVWSAGPDLKFENRVSKFNCKFQSVPAKVYDGAKRARNMLYIIDPNY